MATTIVSNLVVFSDATGHGNQSHLIFAVKQQRWWLFIVKTKTATVVSCYVSSSADLTTATWSSSTDSPAFPSARAFTAADQRYLGVVFFSNDAPIEGIHLQISIAPASGVAYYEHIRATFTGASTISWESWTEYPTSSQSATSKSIHGDVLALSTSKLVHSCSNLAGGVSTAAGVDGDPDVRAYTNIDVASSWTNAAGALTSTDDGMSFACNSYGLAALNNAGMILVYENSSVSDTQSSGLKYNLYVSGATWPNNTGSADVGIGTSTQDENDWCLCAVDTTHIYAIRRDSGSTFLWRVYNGTSWATPTNSIGSQNHQAASGLFAATNGTDMWLFALDSASNNPLMYAKCGNAYGSTPSWSGWTQLEPADTAARNYISGCPYVGNNQIGIIYTRVNGSNFDIQVTALQLFPSVPTAGTRTRTRAKESKRYRPR